MDIHQLGKRIANWFTRRTVARSADKHGVGHPVAARPPWKPRLEPLECRCVPSLTVQGDFNNDGLLDTATGQPYQSVGGIAEAGSVTVTYGNGGSETWTQNSPDILDQVETNDRFGWDLAVGDFNGDGFDDLAIGVPHEDITAGNAGLVHVIYGSASGLTAAGNQIWHQDSDGIVHRNASGDNFGWAVAAGDFNNGRHR
jgi:hypothetical protein